MYMYIYARAPHPNARGSHLACSSPPPRVPPPVPCSSTSTARSTPGYAVGNDAEVDARRGARQDRRALQRARVKPAGSSQTTRPHTPTSLAGTVLHSIVWSGFPADLWYYEPAKNLGTDLVAASGEAEVAQAAAEAKKEADLLELEAADAAARSQGMGV